MLESSPFKRIVFPGLLAASTVFAALTLPFTTTEARQVPLSLPGPFTNWLNPVVQREYRQLSIRYIGFAIMASSATGIATAELMRNRQRQANRQSELLQKMQPVEAGQTVLPGEEPLPTVSLAADTAVQAWTGGDATSGATSGASEWEDLLSDPSLLAWESLMADAQTSAPADHATEAILPETATPETEPSGQASELAPNSLLTVGSHLPGWAGTRTYRIQVPDQPQRLLAIQVQGQYYSFYRVRPTAAQAEALVAQLKQQQKTAIATPHHRGYAVWVWQPDACLDLSSWSVFKPAA